MSRKVRIAELKAKLSEHLRYVRRGGTITVMDRQEPVARITSLRPVSERLVVRLPSGKAPLGKVRLPRRLETNIDVVDLLLEDRSSGR